MLLAITVAFRVGTLGHVEWNGNDETAYLSLLERFDEKGFAEMRSMIQTAPETFGTWSGPMPFRVGYLLVAWVTCKVLGGVELRNLAWLSFASGIGVVLLGFHLLRQWLSARTAFIAGLLLVTSPLAVALSRRALQDSFLAFVVLLAIVAYDRWWRSGKPLHLILWSLILLLGLLTKESMIALVPCFVLAGLWYRKRPGAPPLSAIVIPVLATLLACLLIEAWLSGGFASFFRTYVAYARIAADNPYNVAYNQGPWFSYLVIFLAVSPVAYLGSILGSAASDLGEEDRPGRILATIYVLSALAIFTAAVPINVRYVLFLDVLLRGLSAIGIVAIASKVPKPGLRVAVGIALVAFTMAVDGHQLYRLFLAGNLYDPVAVGVLLKDGFWK